MKKSLLLQGLIKYLSGLLLLGLLLFLPAGTFAYWNAWLFIALLFIPMLIFGAVLLIKDPQLLSKRLQTDEKEDEQKSVIVLSSFLFLGGFIISGLDYRFGWSALPKWLVIVASLLLLVAYGLYIEVMRENAYLSRTVEVQEEQKVVDTGLYGIVRHPMYFSTILLFWAMPLVLGSLWAFLLFLLYPLLLVKRIKNEEAVLSEGLAGYKEYMQKVKYRILPYIW